MKFTKENWYQLLVASCLIYAVWGEEVTDAIHNVFFGLLLIFFGMLAFNLWGKKK